MTYRPDDPPFDPAKVPDSQIPARKLVSNTIRQRTAKRFIPPVPLDWFNRACVLPGKALAVGLLLWRLARLKRTWTVVLTQAGLSQSGLSRWTKYPALRALESAGLILVRRRKKKNPEV